MKAKTSARRRSGYSLIELLTVIAIIGFLAAIALPHLGSYSDEANKAKDQRNAQNLVLIYTTGAAAGVQWPNGDVATKTAAVTAGQSPTTGVFTGTLFRSNVSADAMATAYRFIGVSGNGDLFYDSSASQDPDGH